MAWAAQAPKPNGPNGALGLPGAAGGAGTYTNNLIMDIRDDMDKIESSNIVDTGDDYLDNDGLDCQPVATLGK